MIPYNTMLSPQILEYLRAQDDPAKTIEAAISRSKAFREWKKLQGDLRQKQLQEPTNFGEKPGPSVFYHGTGGGRRNVKSGKSMS